MYSINMEAPDKIYLDIIEDDDIHMIAPSYENNGGVEYIRKDALLEWLKECKNNPIITDLQKGNIQEVINHINEM